MSHFWKDNAGSPFDTYKQGAVASRGMVSSNHPMASAAGLEMLAMGGNAIDAAIATAFALTVVEPMMIGIFGAGFINFYNGNTGQFVNVDNYAIAPKSATADMFGTVSDDWPDYMETVDRANDVGYRAVGVPGALMGWCHAEEKHGTLNTGFLPASIWSTSSAQPSLTLPNSLPAPRFSCLAVPLQRSEL